MLRLGSEGSYQVLKQILIDQHFTQKELIEQTKLTKGRISQIIGWLCKKQFLRKNKRAFELVSHQDVLRLIHLLRDFEPAFTIRVATTDIEELWSLLQEDGIVMCESTSLCFYDLYCTHKELDFYVEKTKLLDVEKRLKALPPGDFLIKAYLPDLPLSTDTNYIGAQRITGEVRTVIDLFTAGKSGEARGLTEKLWPTSGGG